MAYSHKPPHDHSMIKTRLLLHCYDPCDKNQDQPKTLMPAGRHFQTKETKIAPFQKKKKMFTSCGTTFRIITLCIFPANISA